MKKTVILLASALILSLIGNAVQYTRRQAAGRLIQGCVNLLHEGTQVDIESHSNQADYLKLVHDQTEEFCGAQRCRVLLGSLQASEQIERKTVAALQDKLREGEDIINGK